MINGGFNYDLKRAGEFCDFLGINNGANGRLLHVGSGAGALVYESWRRGLESYGCEVNPRAQGYAPDRIYRSEVQDIYFPADHFQQVVMAIPEDYNVMLSLLGEAFRVTAQGGTCIIGLPPVFYYEGVNRIHKAGFTDLEEVSRDDLSVIFKASKPVQKRISLLLPPGVGDVYWPLVKTQALLAREGIGPPVDVYVAAPRAKKYNSEARSFPFLEMFPFLHSTGEVKFGRGPIWREAYLQQGRTVFRNVQDCDYFITWNGHLRAGKTLEEIDPDLACNWYLPRFISLKEEAYHRSNIEAYGEYLVLYWSFSGTNRQVLRHFTLEQIASSIRQVIDRTGLKPILVGAIWDLDCPYLEQLRVMLPASTVDLRGKTDIEEIFGLMRGAKAVMGMNSGITVMSAAFKVPTALLIHDYLFTNGVHRDFAWNTVPPDVRGKTYFAEFADQTGPDELADRVVSMVKGDALESRSKTVRHKAQKVAPGSDSPVASIRDFDQRTVVACVLKSGGYFDQKYVLNLKSMVSKHITVPYEFVCLTDVTINGCKTILLQDQLVGWWSKLELFRPGLFDCDVAIYFDLDTLIMENIDELLKLNQGFYGLRPWNLANRAKGQTASGVMVWQPGQFDFIYKGFNLADINNGKTDQGYITTALRSNGIQWKALQDHISGIRSYKRECRNGPPSGTRVVCFHGRPRVHECQDKWVKEVWR